MWSLSQIFKLKQQSAGTIQFGSHQRDRKNSFVPILDLRYEKSADSQVMWASREGVQHNTESSRVRIREISLQPDHLTGQGSHSFYKMLEIYLGETFSYY